MDGGVSDYLTAAIFQEGGKEREETLQGMVVIVLW